MFCNNDKIALALINAVDVNGKTIFKSLPLPLNQGKLSKEIASVEVFEYHDEACEYCLVPFKIHVGEVITLKDLMPYFSSGKVVVRNSIEFPSADCNVCIQDINGFKKIIAIVNENDIVVQDSEKFEFVVQKLSYHYNQMYKEIESIKQLSLIGKRSQ